MLQVAVTCLFQAYRKDGESATADAVRGGPGCSVLLDIAGGAGKLQTPVGL